MEFVTWDDYSIPNMMGKIIQMFQTTDQLWFSFGVCQKHCYTKQYLSGFKKKQSGITLIVQTANVLR